MHLHGIRVTGRWQKCSSHQFDHAVCSKPCCVFCPNCHLRSDPKALCLHTLNSTSTATGSSTVAAHTSPSFQVNSRPLPASQLPSCFWLPTILNCSPYSTCVLQQHAGKHSGDGVQTCNDFWAVVRHVTELQLNVVAVPIKQQLTDVSVVSGTLAWLISSWCWCCCCVDGQSGAHCTGGQLSHLAVGLCLHASGPCDSALSATARLKHLSHLLAQPETHWHHFLSSSLTLRAVKGTAHQASSNPTQHRPCRRHAGTMRQLSMFVTHFDHTAPAASNSSRVPSPLLPLAPQCPLGVHGVWG